MQKRPWLRVACAVVAAGVTVVVVSLVLREGLTWHRNQEAAKAVGEMRRAVDRMYDGHSPVTAGCRSVAHSMCVTVAGEPEDVVARLAAMLDQNGRPIQRGCDRFRPGAHSDEWQSCSVQGVMEGQQMVLNTSTAAQVSTGPGAAHSTDVGIFAVQS